MPQTKDPVLEKMRAAASSKQITDDFPALIALLDSLDFWRKRKEDPALCRNFVQIVFNSENYGLSYEALEEICGYREKTIRTHCKAYMEYFLHRYNYYRKLPFVLLIMRYIEFYMDTELMLLIGKYKRVSMKEVPELAAVYALSAKEKDMVLCLYDYFTERDDMRAAG